MPKAITCDRPVVNHSNELVKRGRAFSRPSGASTVPNWQGGHMSAAPSSDCIPSAFIGKGHIISNVEISRPPHYRRVEPSRHQLGFARFCSAKPDRRSPVCYRGLLMRHECATPESVALQSHIRLAAAIIPGSRIEPISSAVPCNGTAHARLVTADATSVAEANYPLPY